jgi:hypothetical protein
MSRSRGAAAGSVLASDAITPLKQDRGIMTESPTYAGPADPSAVGDDDVHEALGFLIAIEPNPDDDDIESSEDYEAHMAQFGPDIVRAMTTLRAFAAQRQRQSLIEMQEAYYGFTNDDRYLETAEIADVVRSALSQAWDGIGPWRK